MATPILPETVQDEDIFSLMKQTNEKAKEKKKKWWNSDPKFYADAQDSVSQWFNNDNLEFESSFGIKKKENFVYGLDRSYFVTILNKISNDTSWTSLSPDWKKIEEMNFEKNVRLVHHVGEQDHWIPEWKATMKIQNGSLDGSPVDIRLNLNIELQSQALRFSKVTNYRFKRRRSFQRGIFRIDFTCIKQGSSPQDVMKSKTIYQAEIEWDKTKCSSLSEAKDAIPAFFEIVDQFLVLCQSKDKKATDHNFVTKVHKIERAASTPSAIMAPPKKRTKKEQTNLINAKKTADEEMKEWSKKFDIPQEQDQEPTPDISTNQSKGSSEQENSESNAKSTAQTQGPKKRGRKPIDPKIKAVSGSLKAKGKNKFSPFEFSPLKESFSNDNPSSTTTNVNNFAPSSSPSLSSSSQSSTLSSLIQQGENSSSIVSDNPFASSGFGNQNPFSSNMGDLTAVNPFQ